MRYVAAKLSYTLVKICVPKINLRGSIGKKVHEARLENGLEWIILAVFELYNKYNWKH